MTTADTDRKCIHLTLPFPPSVNNYWRAKGRIRFISKNGKAYRKAVDEAVLEQWTEPRVMEGRLKVWIAMYPPNRIRRDCDNQFKAVLDSMQHAGIYNDDSQIDDLRILRCELDPPDGSLVVTLEELT